MLIGEQILMSWRSLVPSSSGSLQSENSGLHTVNLEGASSSKMLENDLPIDTVLYTRRLESSSMLL